MAGVTIRRVINLGFDLASAFSFTVSPATSATSATDGMVLVATLVCWSFMLDFMSFRFPVVQRCTAAPRLRLVRDGRMLRRHMRREFITDQELNAKIRQQGVEDIKTVKRMYLEADGEMSLIRHESAKAAS